MLWGAALACAVASAAAAQAQAARELTEAELIAVAIAPVDPANLRPVVLGTLRGAPVWAEYLCAKDCPGGAYRVVHFRVSGEREDCFALDGVWADLPAGPGRQRSYCVPRTVRYAQEVAQARPLSEQDLADFATGVRQPATPDRETALGVFHGVLVRSERHSGDTGLFGTWIVWLDPPKGQDCEQSGGVRRAVLVPRGIISTTEGFCQPKPYAEARDREREAALQRGREHLGLPARRPDTPAAAAPPARSNP